MTMAHRHRRSGSGGSWPILNRLAQLNVAIGLCLAGMIRLSMEFSNTETDRPDPVVVLAFFVVMGAAIFFVLKLRRELNRLPVKWHRIVVALSSFGIQFAILELLLLFVVE
jgi:hypothetical protein